jgi:hypothetical protein
MCGAGAAGLAGARSEACRAWCGIASLVRASRGGLSGVLHPFRHRPVVPHVRWCFHGRCGPGPVAWAGESCACAGPRRAAPGGVAAAQWADALTSEASLRGEHMRCVVRYVAGAGPAWACGALVGRWARARCGTCRGCWARACVLLLCSVPASLFAPQSAPVFELPAVAQACCVAGWARACWVVS